MQFSLSSALLRSSSAVLNSLRGIAVAGSWSSPTIQAASFTTAPSEDTWHSLFNSPSQWEDLRPVKAAGGSTKLPDFRQKATQFADGTRPPALWIDSKSVPDWVAEKLPTLQLDPAETRQPRASASSSGCGDGAETEPLWQSLFDSPSEWEDLRPIKSETSNARLPDFRKKGRSSSARPSPALWIQARSGTPAWVADRLPTLQVAPAETKQPRAASGSTSEETEALWRALFNSPSEWEDMRLVKETSGNARLPDFRKTGAAVAEQAAAVWIDDRRTPVWVADKLSSLSVPPAKMKTRGSQ